jgi:predicted amidophosphoribosyltransferase
MLATPNEAQRGLLAQVGRAALGLVLDTALPPLCAACRQPVGSGRGLCAACWSKVSFIAPPYCERLGIPFAYDPGPGILSMEAIADPPSYGRAPAPRCVSTTSPATSCMP